MSWKVPKRRTRSESPLGVDAINENIHEFVSEVGAFNEHNFNAKRALCTKNSQIPYEDPDEAALVMHRQYWWSSTNIGAYDIDMYYHGMAPHGATGKDEYGTIDIGHIGDASTRIHIPPWGYASAGGWSGKGKKVQNSPAWQSLVSLEGTIKNCTLWVICSFSFIQSDEPFREEYEHQFDKGKRDGSAQFALRLNGSIIWETATGTADISGDPLSHRELHGPCSLTLDALIPTLAGPIKLELIGRVPENSYYASPRALSGDLIALEFRR